MGFVIVFGIVATLGASCGEPHDLTCEYMSNPVGIDSPVPRLSWKLPAGVERQSSYELELDGERQGKRRDEQSLNRLWSGKPLTTGSRHSWRVRIWDQDGRPSGWSRQASFTMGVMRSGDWKAKWIGPSAATRPDVDFLDASWMMSKTDVLRTSFELDDLPETKEMVFLSRSKYDLFVNGKKSKGSFFGQSWTSRFAKFHDLANDELVIGHNVVEFKAQGHEPLSIIAVMRERGRSVAAVCFENAEKKGGVRDVEWCRNPVLRDEIASPAFERVFHVTKGVRTATLFITGLGFYEASLNGRKIGDKVLDPSPTDYSKRVLYSTYLLDGNLVPGENVLRVLVGHGFYDVRHKSTWDNDMAQWRNFPRMIAQLEITYVDGTRESIVSDETWRQVKSPVAWDDIREGEIIGGGHVREPAFPEKGFPVEVVEPPGGRLVAESMPPTRIIRENRPTRIVPVRGCKGCFMVEFPENVAGWVRMRTRGLKRGDVVSIRYDERADVDMGPATPACCCRQGNRSMQCYDRRMDRTVMRSIDAYFKGSMSANVCLVDNDFQTDRFISSGVAEEVYEPRFTYNGFQYVLVSGLIQSLEPDDIVQCVLSTDFNEIGSFVSSDPILNRLVGAATRSYRANFTVGVPTDCPHREKNGWTGDASIASEFAQYVFENTPAYEKWLKDVVDAQRTDGNLPGVVPTAGWGYKWGNGPAWDSALPVIAWNLWNYRDDRKILDEIYPALKRYLDYTAQKSDEIGLVRHGLGDWIPVRQEHVPPVEFISSCYYYQALRIASGIAVVKGLDAESKDWKAAAGRTRDGLRKKFRKKDGVWANGGQTAQGMALAFGLVSDMECQAVVRQLVASVEREGCHIDTGVIGAKHVFRALSRVGRADLAFKMLTNPSSPSMADWVRKNGTTLWEDWQNGFSRNHVMFGDFLGWAYQYLAGIRLPEESGSCSAILIASERAFRKVVFAPCVVDELNHVSAVVETPFGSYESSWARENGIVKYRFGVPPGGSAVIRILGHPDETVCSGIYER